MRLIQQTPEAEEKRQLAKAAYARKVAAGLCTWGSCQSPPQPGRRMCETHGKHSSAYQAGKMMKRAFAGLCRQSGCDNKPVQGKTLCKKHLMEMRKWGKDRKTHGLCRNCPNPVLPGHTRCCNCRLKGVAKRWKTTIEVLKEIWTGVCPYSGRKIEIGVNASLDHKVSRKLGGTNDKSNLQWVHKEVNNAKHQLTEEQFKVLIEDCYRNLNR